VANTFGKPQHVAVRIKDREFTVVRHTIGTPIPDVININERCYAFGLHIVIDALHVINKEAEVEPATQRFLERAGFPCSAVVEIADHHLRAPAHEISMPAPWFVLAHNKAERLRVKGEAFVKVMAPKFRDYCAGFLKLHFVDFPSGLRLCALALAEAYKRGRTKEV
jgi:hypothetical protein